MNPLMTFLAMATGFIAFLIVVPLLFTLQTRIRNWRLRDKH